MNFGEVFSIWLHIKILRVFVESILRYGLPPNFQGMIVKPKNKQEKKTLDTLNKHFAFLGSSVAKAEKDDQFDEIQGVVFEKDYKPYVCFDLKWEY